MDNSNQKGFAHLTLLASLGAILLLTLVITLGNEVNKNNILSEQYQISETVSTAKETPVFLGVPQNLKLVKMECREGHLPLGYFSWEQVSSATHYRLYLKNKEGKELKSIYTEAASYKMDLLTETDSFIGVVAFRKVDGKIIADSARSKDIAVSSSQIKTQCGIKIEKDKEPGLEVKTFIPKTASDSQKSAYQKLEEKKKLDGKESEVKKERDEEVKRNAQLEEKVSQLEREVAQNRKETSALARLVENLLSFFKTTFSFGK